MTPYQQLWLIAFTKTQIVEISAGLVFLYFSLRDEKDQSTKLTSDAFVLFMATAMTHPLLWFIFPRIKRSLGLSYQEFVIYGELAVFLIEGMWYSIKLSKFKGQIVKAMLLSLFLNILSYFSSMLI